MNPSLKANGTMLIYNLITMTVPGTTAANMVPKVTTATTPTTKAWTRVTTVATTQASIRNPQTMSIKLLNSNSWLTRLQTKGTTKKHSVTT